MSEKVSLLYHGTPEAEHLLFEEVGGLPLLLRNILVLERRGHRELDIYLPAHLKAQYKSQISPELKNRRLQIRLKLFRKPLQKMTLHNCVSAHALIVETREGYKIPFLVQKPQDLRKATRLLLENIRLGALGPVARHLNKRISLPISLWLTRLKIHPNTITLVNMVLGITSGFFVAMGGYGLSLFGAFLFQAASVLDGCDGEVAKLSFKTSKFGQYLDSISDNGALFSFFAGLMVAFASGHSLNATLGMGFLLFAGLGGLFWQIILFLKRHTRSASLATFDKEYLSRLPLPPNSFLMRFIEVGKIFMRKDCFSLAFFLTALVGLLPIWPHLALGGVWIANGVLLYLKQVGARAPSKVEV